MISSQIIQSTIDELAGITKTDLAVWDLNANVIATTFDTSNVASAMISEFVHSPADSQVVGADHFLKIMDEEELIYILDAKGLSEDAYMIGRIAVSELQNLYVAYKERFDRNNFFQNLILDNLLLVDIYNRAKRLHLEVAEERSVFLVEAKNDKDGNVTELLKGMFSQQTGDYVTAVDEDNVILIKSLKEDSSEGALEEIANSIVSTMNTEALLNVHVSYGTVVKELKDVSKSYKEAKMALDVGKIFYAEKSVVAYRTLGIGRLIYQLPINLCKIFIEEVFGPDGPHGLDEETLTTVNKFLENNLNVSETSRQLFIHRNTLVYRIEKLKQNTGLDIRIFDDALTLQIALMVMNYMKYLDHVEIDY
ncbi:MAG: helix-turn-helix domain-containing protein [Lachnospiraceae bacterium]|nr:helix-turn-helix domain-containing protein [Lachnospiraceae bacterium]